MGYLAFKNQVMDKEIGDGECVSLVVNNPQAYIEYLFPGVSWPSIMASVQSAKQLAGKSNKYLTWVPNDHNNPNQVPPQGAIGVFDATPQPGYTNPYKNEDGHAGIFDSASPAGYALLQQNAPAFGEPVNVTNYPWRFRPCLGWYLINGVHVVPQPTPAPSPKPKPNGNVGRDLFLPATTGPWHLYNDNGPYIPAKAKGILVPSEYGGLHYTIVGDRGNGVFIINSQMFGQGALWTAGSDVVIR